VVVALIVAAFSVRAPRPRDDRAAPNPWTAGAFTLLVASAFLGVRYVLEGWPIVIAYLALYALAAVTILRWSGRAGWGPVHRVALAGGALLSYAWNSFIQPPVLGSTGLIDLIGNAVFSLGAVALLAASLRAASREPGGRAIA